MNRCLSWLGSIVLMLACARPVMGAGMCGATSEAAPAESVLALCGTVLDTTNASRYTYVQIDTGSGKIWMAGPKTAVKVGDCVTAKGTTPNANFYSPTLKRNFEELYFVESINPCPAGSCAKGVMTNGACASGGACAKEMAAACPTGSQPAAHAAPAAPANVAAAVAVELVPKAPGGKTVAEIWAEKDALAGKQVVVRGKVVKVTPNIMGKTFVHLRDGTGAEGANDLVVTTKDQVAIKSIVTAGGVLTKDKDFGAGYKYDIIMEDASVTAK